MWILLYEKNNIYGEYQNKKSVGSAISDSWVQRIRSSWTEDGVEENRHPLFNIVWAGDPKGEVP